MTQFFRCRARCVAALVVGVTIVASHEAIAQTQVDTRRVGKPNPSTMDKQAPSNPNVHAPNTKPAWAPGSFQTTPPPTTPPQPQQSRP